MCWAPYYTSICLKKYRDSETGSVSVTWQKPKYAPMSLIDGVNAYFQILPSFYPIRLIYIYIYTHTHTVGSATTNAEEYYRPT